MERLDWFVLSARERSASVDDYDELGRQLTDFVARWGDRLRDAEQTRTLLACAAGIRVAFQQNELVYRHDVLLALAWRRDVLNLENLFALDREMFRDIDAMAPEERQKAEALIGSREETLGTGYRAIESTEATLEKHLAKMQRDWAERANADFARRVRTADNDTVRKWVAEVEAELERLKAAQSG